MGWREHLFSRGPARLAQPSVPSTAAQAIVLSLDGWVAGAPGRRYTLHEAAPGRHLCTLHDDDGGAVTGRGATPLEAAQRAVALAQGG